MRGPARGSASLTDTDTSSPTSPHCPHLIHILIIKERPHELLPNGASIWGALLYASGTCTGTPSHTYPK